MLPLLQFFVAKFLILALHLEAGSFPRPLTPKEEIEAFASLCAGDPAAREKLIRHNLRLVAHITKMAPGTSRDFPLRCIMCTISICFSVQIVL